MNSISQDFKNCVACTPNNSIYLKPMRLSCPYCRTFGPKKIIKSLWKLKCHLDRNHNLENYSPLIENLSALIKSGVLR